MIPILIGVFIVAVLAASLVDTMNLNLKEAGQARELVNVGQSVDRILNLLRDPAICTANFRGLPASGANPTAIKTNSSGADRFELAVGDLLPTRNLLLRALSLRDYRAYTTGPSGPDSHGTVELDVVYEPPTGGVSRRRALLVSTELDSARRIQTCVALGRAADFWALTPASDIWFSGPVAIGDVKVPADYRLYIAGYVQSQDFYHVSDRRKKYAVKPLVDSDRLALIRGVAYEWARDRRPAIGVLAQDVERAYPSAVEARGPEKWRAVESDQLVAPLVERVKTLARRNEALAARLRRLRAAAPGADSRRQPPPSPL